MKVALYVLLGISFFAFCIYAHSVVTQTDLAEAHSEIITLKNRVESFREMVARKNFEIKELKSNIGPKQQDLSKELLESDPKELTEKSPDGA